VKWKKPEPQHEFSRDCSDAQQNSAKEASAQVFTIRMWERVYDQGLGTGSSVGI